MNEVQNIILRFLRSCSTLQLRGRRSRSRSNSTGKGSDYPFSSFLAQFTLSYASALQVASEHQPCCQCVSFSHSNVSSTQYSFTHYVTEATKSSDQCTQCTYYSSEMFSAHGHRMSTGGCFCSFEYSPFARYTLHLRNWGIVELGHIPVWSFRPQFASVTALTMGGLSLFGKPGNAMRCNAILDGGDCLTYALLHFGARGCA